MAGSNLKSPTRVRSSAIELPAQPIQQGDRGTGAGRLVFPHNLGRVPAFYSIRLRANKDLTNGILKGMELDLGTQNNDYSGAGHREIHSSWADASNIYFSMNTNLTRWTPDGTWLTHNTNMLPADWDVVVRVMA